MGFHLEYAKGYLHSKFCLFFYHTGKYGGFFPLLLLTVYLTVWLENLNMLNLRAPLRGRDIVLILRRTFIKWVSEAQRNLAKVRKSAVL